MTTANYPPADNPDKTPGVTVGMPTTPVDYPYTSGDVTVLGPEVIASADRKVINWAGTNFVPQADIPELPELQELTVHTPMLAACRDVLGRRVIVHIIGGMQCPGKLTALDADDGTLTIAAGEETFTVALHAVAVLAAKS